MAKVLVIKSTKKFRFRSPYENILTAKWKNVDHALSTRTERHGDIYKSNWQLHGWNYPEGSSVSKVNGMWNTRSRFRFLISATIDRSEERLHEAQGCSKLPHIVQPGKNVQIIKSSDNRGILMSIYTYAKLRRSVWAVEAFG